ncbi:MAG: hypothetical protein EOL92_00495 [Bacteroidia bacterium]|nr:hypothetical protein [Bacteroidia bacterium]
MGIAIYNKGEGMETASWGAGRAGGGGSGAASPGWLSSNALLDEILNPPGLRKAYIVPFCGDFTKRKLILDFDIKGDAEVNPSVRIPNRKEHCPPELTASLGDNRNIFHDVSLPDYPALVYFSLRAGSQFFEPFPDFFRT